MDDLSTKLPGVRSGLSCDSTSPGMRRVLREGKLFLSASSRYVYDISRFIRCVTVIFSIAIYVTKATRVPTLVNRRLIQLAPFLQLLPELTIVHLPMIASLVSTIT